MNQTSTPPAGHAPSPAPGSGHDEQEVHVNPNASVFSELCDYEEGTGGRGGEDRRAPVFVKLWEWNFVDIERECREYLGPNGFDAVQLSPITEHKRGAAWWTKYQPISFGLNSRSGTVDEFRHMVAECREAGVQVIVDVILNHIATPCQAASGTPAEGDDVAPCLGWNGSTYGNRRISGARDWDAATPELFRHPPGHPLRGVCAVGAPSYLCGSMITTDCSCCKCDLYGLPDWNTELQEVLDLHYRHLEELYDLGVTMLRIDAALYEDVGQTSRVLNRFPWDYVYMEWWGEYPRSNHGTYIGNYRDVALAWKVTDALATEANLTKLPKLLDLTYGVFGVDDEKAVYPITFHDKRTDEAVQSVASYKNGLEYHQQQKFWLAWPKTTRVLLWGGFGWSSIEQGPPGCELGQDLCTPDSVFGSGSKMACMPTPTVSPLPKEDAQKHQWVCEHRWTGVAGVVGFRKACRGLPVAGLPGTGKGRLAFKVGDECFVALVKGTNERWPQGYGHLGSWSLKGLAVDLPAGRYCDVAALPARFEEGATSCPREVVVGSNGVIKSGSVSEGDLLAIYKGARLAHHRRLRKGTV